MPLGALTSPSRPSDPGEQLFFTLRPRISHTEWPHSSRKVLVETLGATANAEPPAAGRGLHGAPGSRVAGRVVPVLLLPPASPLLKPQGPGSPGQRRQSRGRSQLSASEPMVGWPCGPAAPGFWALARRPAEGAREQLGMCASSARVEAAEETKAARKSSKGSRAGGEARGWRWRGGAGLPPGWHRSALLSARRLLSMNAAVAAPPPAPLPTARLRLRGGCAGCIRSQAAWLLSPGSRP